MKGREEGKGGSIEPELVFLATFEGETFFMSLTEGIIFFLFSYYSTTLPGQAKVSLLT